MFRKIEFKIAWRYLGAQRKSFFVSLISLFSILGVTIGTFALITVLSAINGFESVVTEQMMGKDAHIEVMRYHGEAEPKYTVLLDELRKKSEVKSAAPFIITKVGISSKKANDGIVLYGIDAEDSKGVLALESQIKYGHYDLDSTLDTKGRRRPGLILGNGLANRLRVILGDPLVLQTFSGPEQMGMGGGSKMVQCVVTGIFESGMYEYDANLAYVSLSSAQKLVGLESDEVMGYQAKVHNPFTADVFAKKLQKELQYPYYVMDWKAKNATLLKWMGIEKVLFGMVVLLIVIVAAFNIISSLIMMVLEKTREIGILRAMGSSSVSIMRIFILVGSFIGLTGTFLGTLVGVLFCWSQVQYGWLKLPADVYMLSEFPVQIQWMDVLSVFVVGNLICFIATIPPAFKASKLDPVKAIRHE